MNIHDKFTPYYKSVSGGLFEKTNKADVGDNADKMAAEGVAMLSWADPFYPDGCIDEDIIEALNASLESGSAQHYTTPIGNKKLKQALSEKLLKENHLTADPMRNIIITSGSDCGLFFSLTPFISPGDEVLVVDPSYPNNFQAVRLLGGIPVSVPVFPENDFELDIAEFEKRVTSKTKMVLLTSPNNPTTTVYSRKTLEALAEFIIDHDLLIVVDQAFEDIIFDEKEMVTMAALPGMWERTITIFSISKGWGLSGFRIGYIVADDKIMDKYYATAVSIIGAVNTAAQHAAIIACKKRYEYIDAYREVFDRRRKIIYEALSDIKGVHMKMPQSSFLSWVDISELGTSDEIVDYLINEAKVNVNSGVCYGANGEGYIRIIQGCYSDESVLVEAIERIRKALIKKSDEVFKVK